MISVADYHSPLGKQLREYVLAELLEAFQKIREDRNIPLDSEGDAMRMYVEAQLRQVREPIEVAA